MSSKISKMLQASLKPVFKSEGFRKKGRSWGMVTEELGKLFNIQCSQNSDRIYLNIGVYVQEAGVVDFPNELRCHLRFRLEQLLDSKKDILEFYKLTDFEGCEDDQARVDEIVGLVKSKAIPWLRRHKSPLDLVDSHEVKSTMYWNDGRELLETLCAKDT